MSFPMSTAQAPQLENMKTFTTATADSLVHTPTTHIANRVRQWHNTFLLWDWQPGRRARLVARCCRYLSYLQPNAKAYGSIVCNLQRSGSVLQCYLCTVQRRTGGACLPAHIANRVRQWHSTFLLRDWQPGGGARLVARCCRYLSYLYTT